MLVLTSKMPDSNLDRTLDSFKDASSISDWARGPI